MPRRRPDETRVEKIALAAVVLVTGSAAAADSFTVVA
jgi:hypothetical protein